MQRLALDTYLELAIAIEQLDGTLQRLTSLAEVAHFERLHLLIVKDDIDIIPSAKTLGNLRKGGVVIINVAGKPIVIGVHALRTNAERRICIDGNSLTRNQLDKTAFLLVADQYGASEQCYMARLALVARYVQICTQYLCLGFLCTDDEWMLFVFRHFEVSLAFEIDSALLAAEGDRVGEATACIHEYLRAIGKCDIIALAGRDGDGVVLQGNLVLLKADGMEDASGC